MEARMKKEPYDHETIRLLAKLLLLRVMDKARREKATAKQTAES